MFSSTHTHTRLRLVFGLNGCRGRRSASSAMDFANIRALLNFTVAGGYGPFGDGDWNERPVAPSLASQRLVYGLLARLVFHAA